MDQFYAATWSLFTLRLTAGGERYGFRISDDPHEEKQTVFLPGAPNPENGFVMIFASEDVTEAERRPGEVIMAMMHYGRGL